MKSNNAILPGFEPIIEPAFPKGFEPLLKTQDADVTGITFRVGSGSRVRESSRCYAYVMSTGPDLPDDTEYFIPVFDKKQKIFALVPAHAGNAYALHLRKRERGKGGKTRMEIRGETGGYKRIASAFADLIPEWKPKQYKALLFSEGEIIDGALYFRRYEIVEERSPRGDTTC